MAALRNAQLLIVAASVALVLIREPLPVGNLGQVVMADELWPIIAVLCLAGAWRCLRRAWRDRASDIWLSAEGVLGRGDDGQRLLIRYRDLTAEHILLDTEGDHHLGLYLIGPRRSGSVVAQVHYDAAHEDPGHPRPVRLGQAARGHRDARPARRRWT